MVVRELIALFGFKADEKSAKMVGERAGDLFNKIKGLAAIAGTVAAGVLLKGVAESVGKMADNIDTLSSRLGVAAQDLQELEFAADRADVTAEEFRTGLRTLARQAFEAANGNKESAETFALLGVQLRDSRGQLKPVAQLLQESADGVKALKSETDRTALAQRAFGRAGTALVPLLVQGTAAIEEMRKRANALGAVMDQDLIRLAIEWDDSTKDVRDGLQGLKNSIGRALLPVMTRLNRAWVDLLIRHGDFIRSKLSVIVNGLGRAVEALFRVVINTAEAFTTWVRQLDPLRSKLLAVGTTAGAIAVLLSLPAGSLIVLIGLIGLVIEDFFTWRDGGQSVIGDLIGSLDELTASFPVLSTVVGSIGKQISTVFETIVNLVGALAQLLITVWDKPIDALKTFDQQIATLFGIEDLLDKMRELVALTTKIPAALGFGTKTISASSGAGAVSGPSNVQTNNINVSVNASGATSPEAIALAQVRQTEMVLERQNRAALAALTPSVAQP